MSSDEYSPRRNGAVLTIDPSAVATNWHFLQARLGKECALGAVVKADAYGLGIQKIAPLLEQLGCRHFFVADSEEGIRLRQILEKEAAIYVLNGPATAHDAAVMAENQLTPVLNDQNQIDIWRQYVAHHGAFKAVLHVDTGMNRLGFDLKDLPHHAPSIVSELSLDYVMSHLACADSPHHPLNAQQRADIIEAGTILKTTRLSLANSPGIFLGTPYHFSLVRAGGALYGLNPTPEKPNPMQPVITLESSIIQIRSIAPPNSIGYGASFVLDRPKRIATLAMGYADGYPRCLGNRGKVLVAGKWAPIVGRISMDYITLDISHIPEETLSVGDPVQLVGPGYDADDLARNAESIGYEILIRIGQSCRRSYKSGICQSDIAVS